MVLEASGRVQVILEMSTPQDILNAFSDYLIDVLVLDQRLRGLSGVEVAAKLSQIKHAENIDTRILLTTPFATPKLEYEALRCGAAAVVSQEDGPKVLVDTVLSLGAKRRQYSLQTLSDLASEANAPSRVDHVLESHLGSFEERERSILGAVVLGESISEVASRFDVASYRVRKLVEATLQALNFSTLEQLQLRFISAGLAGGL